MNFSFELRKIELGNSAALRVAVEDMFNGSLIGIQIPNFYSQDACDIIIQNCFNEGFEWFEQDVLGRIGVSVPDTSPRQNGEEIYFSKCSILYETRERIFTCFGDPTLRMINEVFSICYTTGIAYDENRQQFCSPGIIEYQRNGRLIHVDDQKESSFEQLIGCPISELSTVVYFQVPELGGELEIFKKKWAPEDEQFKLNPDSIVSRGHAQDLCIPFDKLTFSPKCGDLVIFANCYYHQVLPSIGNKARIGHLCTVYLHEDQLVAYV